MPINYTGLGFDENDNKNLQDAEMAITKADLWDWLKTFEPDPKDGFSFCKAPELEIIGHHMRISHSGASFAMTMCEMQQVARLGINGYCDSFTKMQIGPEFKEKVVVKRTAEMDKKVIHEYHNRAPFARAPKWSYEYIKAFPDVLRNVRFEDEKRPGVSDPTARRLNW
jgi:hypothetical protein